MSERLVDYPYIVVRIACAACKREGAYRLVRLGAKFGAEAGLEEVLARLTFDCPAKRADRNLKRDETCHARFVDLDPNRPMPPPHLPPPLLGPRPVDLSASPGILDPREEKRRRRAERG